METVHFSERALHAINELEKDDIPVSYMILGFDSTGKTLELDHKGEGGVAEVREKLTEYEDKIAVGAFKVTAVDDRGTTTSVRRKYVHFIWVGPKTPIMKKARVGTMSGAFKSKFEGMSLYLQAFDVDVFKEDKIEHQLRASGGAHQPTKYDFSNTFKQNQDKGDP